MSTQHLSNHPPSEVRGGSDEERVSQGKMTRREAGKKGGQSTARTYGREFYSNIGHKGGEVTSQTHGSEFYALIGKKGGEKVSQDRAHMAEIGRKGGGAPHSGNPTSAASPKDITEPSSSS